MWYRASSTAWYLVALVRSFLEQCTFINQNLLQKVFR